MEEAQTPDERLAARIARALCDAGLVAFSEIDELQRKLAAGTAREADWQAWIERSLPRETQESANGGGHREDLPAFLSWRDDVHGVDP